MTYERWLKELEFFFFFNPGGILICQELWRSWGFTRLASWQFSWIQFHRCWRKTWDSETEDRSLQQSHPLQHQHFFVPAPTGQCKTAPDNACTPWVALQERKPVHRKSHPFMIVCKQTHPTVFLGDDRYYLSTHIFEIEQKAVSAFSRRTSRKRRDPSLFSTVTTFCHFRGKKQCPVGENLPKATFMVDREIFLLKKKKTEQETRSRTSSKCSGVLKKLDVVRQKPGSHLSGLLRTINIPVPEEWGIQCYVKLLLTLHISENRGKERSEVTRKKCMTKKDKEYFQTWNTSLYIFWSSIWAQRGSRHFFDKPEIGP